MEPPEEMKLTAAYANGHHEKGIEQIFKGTRRDSSNKPGGNHMCTMGRLHTAMHAEMPAAFPNVSHPEWMDGDTTRIAAASTKDIKATLPNMSLPRNVKGEWGRSLFKLSKKDCPITKMSVGEYATSSVQNHGV